MQVQERLDAFEKAGARVVAITFATVDRLKEYLNASTWRVEVLADPDRDAYRAFGLESAGVGQLMKPSVMLSYVGLLLKGRRPRAATEDVHQLGGDFVVDAAGIITYVYRSKDPADRPGVDVLIAEAKAAKKKR